MQSEYEINQELIYMLHQYMNLPKTITELNLHMQHGQYPEVSITFIVDNKTRNFLRTNSFSIINNEYIIKSPKLDLYIKKTNWWNKLISLFKNHNVI